MSEDTEYFVTGYVSATSSQRVRATSPEAAVEASDLNTSLCHQCARHIEVGDVYSVEVSDANREVVLKDDDHPDVDRQARQDVRALAKHLAKTGGLPREIAEIVKRWEPGKKRPTKAVAR
jgi:hypothetical protein